MKGSVAQVGRPCRVRVSITFFPPFARLFVIGSRHTIVRNGELSGRIIERACFPCYRFLLSLSLSSKTPSFSYAVRCRRTRVNKPRVRDKGNIYIYTWNGIGSGGTMLVMHCSMHRCLFVSPSVLLPAYDPCGCNTSRDVRLAERWLISFALFLVSCDRTI